MDKTVLEDLLADMVQSGATTLHLLAGRPPCMRIHGKFVQHSDTPLDLQSLEELTRDFLFEDHRNRLMEWGGVDVLYASRSAVRFRTSVMRQDDGLGLLFRRLPVEIPDFEELSIPELFNCFSNFHNGLVVVTGFHGSGKSTSLAALVERLNRESACHIVTVEDPIEFIYGQGEALIHQREVGAHVQTFAEGIRQAARQGAEVIAVSELNSYESLLAMLEASERGCLILTTFDASSVVGACTEIMSLAPADDRPAVRVRLAHSLRAMVSQILLKRSGGKGRIPLFEVLINNAMVTRAIRAANFQDLPKIMRRSRGLGMQTADTGLRSLLSRRLIDEDEALYYADDWEFVTARSTMSAQMRSKG